MFILLGLIGLGMIAFGMWLEFYLSKNTSSGFFIDAGKRFGGLFSVLSIFVGLIFLLMGIFGK